MRLRLALPVALFFAGSLACAGVQLKARPEITSLSADLDRITEGDTLTLEALVTDPQGKADILGGTLSGPEGAPTYGVFTGDGTSWTLELDWVAIDAVTPIVLETETTWTFQAVFYDAAGHASEPASIDLALYCGEGEGTCGQEGVCPDLPDDPENCGSCGATCDGYLFYDIGFDEGPETHVPVCQEGRCVVTTDCARIEDQRNCKQVCEDAGYEGCATAADPVGLAFSTREDRCDGDIHTSTDLDCTESIAEADMDFFACHCRE